MKQQHLLLFAGRLIACLAVMLSVAPVGAWAQGYSDYNEERKYYDYGMDRQTWFARDRSLKWFNEHKNDTEVKMVDMGLSVNWASFNIGAVRLDSVGDIFAWGETKPKTMDVSKSKKGTANTTAYTWANYKWASGHNKYNYADGKTRLEPEDDAATANMGGDWRMPTKEEWAELFHKDNSWVSVVKKSDNSEQVVGLVIESQITSNRIYLPLSLYWTADLGGYIDSTDDLYNYLSDYDIFMRAMAEEACAGGVSGNFNLNDMADGEGKNFAFFVGPRNMYAFGKRSAGMQVRAVCPNPNYTRREKAKVPDSITHYGTVAEAVDMGLSVKWSSWNLGADSIGRLGATFILGDNKPNHNNYYEKKVTDWVSYHTSAREHDKDAAKELWGDGWRTPTAEEWKELRDPRLCTWTIVANGPYVYYDFAWRVTSRITGNSIILPLESHVLEMIEENLYFPQTTTECYTANFLCTGDSQKPTADQVKMSNEKCDIEQEEIWQDARIRPVAPYTDGQEHKVTMPEERATVEAVDLGLSVRWASCNVGAFEGAYEGDYFLWGDTLPMTDYPWMTYTKPKKSQLKKILFGGHILEPEVDAAHANLGGDWRMPTEAEWDELFSPLFCKWDWTSNYNGSGESGYVVTSLKNGNSIFLPAAGFTYGEKDNIYCRNDLFYSLGDESNHSYEYGCIAYAHGRFLFNDMYSCRTDPYCYYNQSSPYYTFDSRYRGLQVRAVCPNMSTEMQQKAETKPAMHEAEAVDLGLSVLWASCNIGSVDGISAGGYFSFGATEPYSVDNRKPAKLSSDSYRKTEDGTRILQPQADAASVNMGGDWRMPTEAEWNELANKELCKWTLVGNDNFHGYLVTSLINGNSIFLPGVGYAEMRTYDLYIYDSLCYWSSCLKEKTPIAFSTNSYRSSTDFKAESCLQIRAVKPRPQ